MDEKRAVLFSFWGVAVSSRPHQMIPALEAECVTEAQVRGVTLPSDWSVRNVVEELSKAMMDVQPAVWKMAASLRRSGLLTAVLLDHWLDDGADGDDRDNVIDVSVVLQAVWVDADEDSVKAARAAGMEAILVEDLGDALGKLGGFAVGADAPPPSCSPDQVSHGYVAIRVKTCMGSGPPVLLCHGFPESWYSWRYQIPALAAAGFRVLALDMKGYGESTAPPGVFLCSVALCSVTSVLHPSQAIPQVTLVGHDWGGALVWSMAQFFPERVRAAASLNTPLFRANPSSRSSDDLLALPMFDYQIYFQKPGVAEAELEKDLERTFNIFFFSKNGSPSQHRGLFVGLPEQIPRSCLLTEADLQFYVSQYRERGFRSPLNWYRNKDVDRKWMGSRPLGKVLIPSLMVTTGKDPVLLPVLSQGMEDLIPNLSRGHIEECGHWTQMERPAETNRILISWLKETHKKPAGVGVAPKL
uniref:AB hydrolase-1 domain-containing protein n=1 Tax=Mola mola TaxID=94237 RepID=A0A3Q3VUV1_MOLML